MGEEMINRQFKDRLFKLVFVTKKDLLNLYNAIKGEGGKRSNRQMLARESVIRYFE